MKKEKIIVLALLVTVVPAALIFSTLSTAVIAGIILAAMFGLTFLWDKLNAPDKRRRFYAISGGVMILIYEGFDIYFNKLRYLSFMLEYSMNLQLSVAIAAVMAGILIAVGLFLQNRHIILAGLLLSVVVESVYLGGSIAAFSRGSFDSVKLFLLYFLGKIVNILLITELFVPTLKGINGFKTKEKFTNAVWLALISWLLPTAELIVKRCTCVPSGPIKDLVFLAVYNLALVLCAAHLFYSTLPRFLNPNNNRSLNET